MRTILNGLNFQNRDINNQPFSAETMDSVELVETPILNDSGVESGLKACRLKYGKIYSYWISGYVINSGRINFESVVFNPMDFPEFKKYQGDILRERVITVAPNGTELARSIMRINQNGVDLQSNLDIGTGVYVACRFVLILV
jgi:hypothetical protein